jgi:RIO kinase 1
VTGEYRFRRGYNRKNPRKMVRLWAEKELRNLRRLRAAGIPCPEPLEVRENVLVMSFLGDREGWCVGAPHSHAIPHFTDSRASPRLKDAEIDDQSTYAFLYAELVLNIRKLFHQCKLVHADLSEYNVLYHEGHLYIIDVSQSVEHDHPSAFDFLRGDIKNVEDYFSKMGVRCLGLRRCFEFIVKEQRDTTEGLNDEGMLTKWLELGATEEPPGVDLNTATTGQSAHEDAVFEKSYIPRTLGELYDPEREVAALSLDDWQKPIYADTIELVRPAKQVLGEADNAQVADSRELRVSFPESVSQDSVSDASSEAEEGDTRSFEDKRPRGHRHEDRELKKVH